MDTFLVITSDGKKFNLTKDYVLASRVLYNYFINTPEPKPKSIQIDVDSEKFGRIIDFTFGSYGLLSIVSLGESKSKTIDQIKNYLENYDLADYIEIIQIVDDYQFNILTPYLIDIIIEFLKSNEYLNLWEGKSERMIQAIQSLDNNNPNISKKIASLVSMGKYNKVKDVLNDVPLMKSLNITLPMTSVQGVVSINTLDNLIRDLPKSTKSVQDYKKILPFIEKIAQQHGSDMCRLTTIKGDRGIELHSPDYPIKIKPIIPTGLDREIRDCRNSIIIIPLSITYYDLTTKKLSGHANIIIINKKTKEYERFEPLGYTAREKDQFIDDFMINEFKAIVGPEYNYIYPADFCFRLKLEKKHEFEEIGLCVAQTTIYVHLRLINPHLTQEDVIDYLASLSIDERTDLIFKYVTFMDRFIAGELREHARPSVVGDNLVKIITSNGEIMITQKQIKKLPYLERLLDESRQIELIDATTEQMGVIISLLVPVLEFSKYPALIGKEVKEIIIDFDAIQLIDLIKLIELLEIKELYFIVMSLLTDFLSSDEYKKLWGSKNKNLIIAVESLNYDYPKIANQVIEKLQWSIPLYVSTFIKKYDKQTSISNILLSPNVQYLSVDIHDRREVDRIYNIEDIKGKYRSTNLYNIATGQESTHTNEIISISNNDKPVVTRFSHNRDNFIIAFNRGNQSNVTMYHLNPTNVESIFTLNNNKLISSFQFSSDGNLFALTYEDGTANIYDSNGTIVFTFDQVDFINNISFHHDKNKMAASFKDGSVNIYELNTYREIFSINHDIHTEDNITNTIFSQDKIATYTSEGSLKVHDINTRQELFNKSVVNYGGILTSKRIIHISFSLDDTKLAFTFFTNQPDTGEYQTIVYDTHTWKELFVANNEDDEFPMSPDGHFIIWRDPDVDIYDINTKNKFLEDIGSGITFSRDGNIIAYIGNEGANIVPVDDDDAYIIPGDIWKIILSYDGSKIITYNLNDNISTIKVYIKVTWKPSTIMDSLDLIART